MLEEWFIQKLTALQIEEGRLATLSEIRHKLRDLRDERSLEEAVTAKILTSPEIFNCLSRTGTSEQSQIVCDILSICLSSLNMDRSNISELLERTLKQGNSKVRALALDELFRFLSKNPDVDSLDTSLNLLVISCLKSEETNVGITAVKILSHTLRSQYDDPAIKGSLLKLLESRDIVKCRVYEIAVNLAKSAPSVLVKVQDVLDKLLKEMNNNDVLIQLNVLELLVSLAEQNHGLVYLENHKVFEEINKRVMQIEKNPLDNLLLPGFIKFFGKIAHGQPQRIIEGYPEMVQCLFNCLTGKDLEIVPIAIDTLANLASTPQGKIILDRNHSEMLKEIFEAIRDYIRNVPTDLKKRAFNALEVTFKTEGPISNEVSNITAKWCQHITGSTNLEYLQEFCKNPFPDIKIAALSFVKAICEYPWGVRALKKTAGFMEYLLDRQVEFDKEARFVKYEIISTIADSPIFDAHTLLQIRKFLEEGVYYVEGVVEVAVEEG